MIKTLCVTQGFYHRNLGNNTVLEVIFEIYAMMYADVFKHLDIFLSNLQLNYIELWQKN